jgi:hypothetical protein
LRLNVPAAAVPTVPLENVSVARLSSMRFAMTQGRPR